MATIRKKRSRWARVGRRMSHDLKPDEVPHTAEDEKRTVEAKRVIEEYARGLRGMLLRLRKWLN
jgi:hypothetical protein